MALKCLDKTTLIKSSQSMYVKRECECLYHLHHPFIAEYYGLFLLPRKIIFRIENLPGLELWQYLYSQDRNKNACGGLPIKDSILYLGMIVLALEHIHSLGYCYRDLKSENMLFDAFGYLKIVDFGFAKSVPFFNKAGEIQYRTFTLCGTPDYMAPEVVLTQGHDKSADYWALGVLTYEIVCACTPFESITQKRVFEKIVRSQHFLNFPSDFDPHMKSFVRRLLHPKAALRIGALQNGINDIKEHAIFNIKGSDQFSFNELLAYNVKMPYVPPSDSIIDNATNNGGTNDINNNNNNNNILEEKTAEDLQKEFDDNIESGVEMIDLVEESAIEDDANDCLFQDLLDIHMYSGHITEHQAQEAE